MCKIYELNADIIALILINLKSINLLRTSKAFTGYFATYISADFRAKTDITRWEAGYHEYYTDATIRFVYSVYRANILSFISGDLNKITLPCTKIAYVRFMIKCLCKSKQLNITYATNNEQKYKCCSTCTCAEFMRDTVDSELIGVRMLCERDTCEISYGFRNVVRTMQLSK